MLQARQAAVHSSVAPVAIRAFVVRVSSHNTFQHCLAFGEICQHFGLHVESWMYSHVEIVNDPGMRRSLLFKQPGKRGTSLNCGHWLIVSLGGLLGPRNKFVIKWLLPIWVFSNGLSSSLLLGTKEVVVLKWRTDNLLLFLCTSRGRRRGFSVVKVVLKWHNDRDLFMSGKLYHLGISSGILEDTVLTYHFQEKIIRVTNI